MSLDNEPGKNPAKRAGHSAELGWKVGTEYHDARRVFHIMCEHPLDRARPPWPALLLLGLSRCLHFRSVLVLTKRNCRFCQGLERQVGGRERCEGRADGM